MAASERDPQAATDTRLESSGWAESNELLVSGLTILWHPDIERVGERVALPGLASGRAQEIARLIPEFAQPGSSRLRPLADPRLSRTPIRLAPVPGGVRVDLAGSRTPVEIDGEPLDEATESTRDVDDTALDRGVVLLLGHRVVLLLHRLEPTLPPDLPRHGLVGESPGIVRLRRDVRRVADLGVSVLLRGETGTGKELVARALHAASPRRDEPFVAVNMAAIPASLAAAELFGAEKGAYTGADQRREGHFRRAHGGTLFLDEIGETPVEIQALLLRALETGEIQSVGASKPSAVDVRVVSATDLDLESAVGAERFRAPLLYRLAGFVLRLPPLRERREDFGRLAVHFLRRELEAIGEVHRLAPADHAAGKPWLPAALVARLARHSWPGNVRQLQNAIRQIVIAHRGSERVSDLGRVEEILGDILAEEPATRSARALGETETAEVTPKRRAKPVRKPADIREDELVETLARNHYQVQATADELGIPRGSLYELIEKSPRIRKATEIEADEIEKAIQSHGGSVQAAAEALRVSEQALRRRMGRLGIG